MHLVLGLGNPGAKYKRTRHNAGFLVVDRLADRWGARLDRAQFGALVDRARMGSTDAVLAKPQKFMNLSGQAATSLRGYYKVDPTDVVVVHDDVDIPFGDVRVKAGGGHGGHNGLRDIQAKMGTNDFVRVRFGVSRPPPGWETANYVLGNWHNDETEQLDELVDRAADAVEAVLRDGTKRAMNIINARAKQNEKNGVPAGPQSTTGVERG
jgi:peptidyl-tRNA hydrolase, PTH1 family